MIIGAIELGGSKIVCAIGNEKGHISDRIHIPTETPDRTMPLIIKYFMNKNIEALGVGCFGPIDADKDSKTYGYITSTPKIAWRNYNIVKTLRDALKVPIGFDTDVNAAALGETTSGALTGCKIGIYITIGTGIGVGVCIGGKPMYGLMHPEAGHIILRRKKNDNYRGICPYHRDCFEGLASGPAIEDRWGKKPCELHNDYEVWQLEAEYIAQAIVNYILCYSPNRIVLGGGVMHQDQMFPIIRFNVKEYLNGYINMKEILDDIDTYIVPPALGDDSGIKGAVMLGVNAKAAD